MKKDEDGSEQKKVDQGAGAWRFEDLQVWQVARDLAKGVYQASRSQRLRCDRSLVDQMTRAAISVISNIAEGHERGSRAQNIEFCFYAKGSVGELRSQVIIARDVGLLDETAYRWLYAKCQEVSAQLGGYVKHMQANPRRRLRASGHRHVSKAELK